MARKKNVATPVADEQQQVGVMVADDGEGGPVEKLDGHLHRSREDES